MLLTPSRMGLAYSTMDGESGQLLYLPWLVPPPLWKEIAESVFRKVITHPQKLSTEPRSDVQMEPPFYHPQIDSGNPSIVSKSSRAPAESSRVRNFNRRIPAFRRETVSVPGIERFGGKRVYPIEPRPSYERNKGITTIVTSTLLLTRSH